MVSNLAHPQLLSCEHSQCPHPMLTAGFLVSSYVSFQLSTAEIGLDQLHWTLLCGRAYSPAHHRQVQLSSSFLSTCNWRSPKSDWAAPRSLCTKKGRKVSIDMMKRMNNWLAEIRTMKSAETHPSMHSCEDYCSCLTGCRVAIGCLLDNLASSHLPFTPAIARYICSIKIYCIKFFHLKITLGLDFGESCLFLAQQRKNTDVYKGLFLSGKASLPYASMLKFNFDIQKCCLTW